jgi:hypothetical protein
MAAAIDEDHLMMRRQRTHLVAPIIRIGQAPMQQNNGRPMTDGGVKQFYAIDFCSAGNLTSHRRRRWRQRLPALLGPGGAGKNADSKH